MNKLIIRTFFLFLVSITFYGQHKNTFKIHSHNDYLRNTPFWEAYSNNAASIEIDIILKNDTLFTAHEEESIENKKTIENIYFKQIEVAYDLYNVERSNIQLLIDIKSEPYAALDKLIKVLQNFKHLLKTADKNGITIVVSGNRPSVSDYPKYPNFITFDHQNLDDIPQESWKKIGLISLNFKDYTNWNGKGRLTAKDFKIVNEVIIKAHSYGKPFRFWATPDSKTAWKTFTDLGVDFINTDMPYKATIYLTSLKDRLCYNKIKSDVYFPTFKSDQKNRSVKNIILLIGDGNGLSQISSAVLANGGQLTLTQLEIVGLIKTQSSDDFTTDSAAGGTALSTGVKSYNRSIGVDTSGIPVKNLFEILGKENYVTGCITTDDITGATPAAFYAHQKDRSEEDNIAQDLLKSNLSLFIGGGKHIFQNTTLESSFTIINSLDELASNKKDRIGYFISNKDIPGIIEGRDNILAEATKSGLEFLHAKKEPFFMMIEGAQIDSYGHSNNTCGIISEGIDFDKAITEAIKFADRTKNTLVIITADHETSGFSIPQGNMENGMIEGDFITKDHTGVMVPIFAYGPQSQEFQGVYNNTEVFHKILKVLKIKQ